jgi:cell division septal protein FtsQ
MSGPEGGGPGTVRPREREAAPPEHPALRERRRQVAREQGRRRRNRGLWLLGAFAGLAVLYWLLTGPLLSIGSVTMSGYDRPDRAEVAAALAGAARTGTVVSPARAAMERAVAPYPWVESITVTRRLPRSAYVQVVQARPMAIAQSSEGAAVLVSSQGRVLEPADPAADMARMTLPGQVPATGADLPAAWADLLLFVAALEADLSRRVRDLRLDQDGLAVARLEDGPEVRLGRPVRLRAKATALALVLSALSAEDRARAAYVDVSVPEHPAVGGLEAAQAAAEVVDDELVDTDGNGIPDTPSSVLYGPDGPPAEPAENSAE